MRLSPSRLLTLRIAFVQDLSGAPIERSSRRASVRPRAPIESNDFFSSKYVNPVAAIFAIVGMGISSYGVIKCMQEYYKNQRK